MGQGGQRVVAGNVDASIAAVEIVRAAKRSSLGGESSI